MKPIHTLLRTATADSHAALEAAMALSPLTLDRYVQALQMLHAVRAGWEPQLDRFFPNLQRPHLGRLAADLAVLRRPTLSPAPPPPATDQATAWGVRYVLEGSALGGRMLLQQAAIIGLTATNGARYFAGEGPETGRLWAAFLVELDAAATETTSAAIVQGAVNAFRALQDFAEQARGGLCPSARTETNKGINSLR